VVGGYFVSVITDPSSSNSSLSEQLLINLKYFWLIYAGVAVLSAYGFLRYSSADAFLLKRTDRMIDYKVIFQITSRGFNKIAIERGVRSILYWAPRYLTDYEIWVVTEDDVDKDFFNGLRNISDEDGRRVNVIYIPSEYRTSRNTKYKARALRYALELRRRSQYISERVWVYLMDEESIIGEDTILGIIDLIMNECKKGRLIGQGLIVYSNFWSRNMFTSMADSLRPSDDLGRHKAQAIWGKVQVGNHDSHLLFRSDLEDKIGWDFGEVRAEDALFGIKVCERYGKVFGWLRGSSMGKVHSA